jgi:hypothetical protein
MHDETNRARLDLRSCRYETRAPCKPWSMNPAVNRGSSTSNAPLWTPDEMKTSISFASDRSEP